MMISVFCPDSGQAEPVSVAGRPVYAAPECMEYAKAVFQDVGALTEEPMLREVHDAGLLWQLGLQEAEESARDVRARAGNISEALLKSQTDCVIVAPPNILRFLLRALEKRRCVIRRTRSGVILPGERIRVTERSDHCGGCQHNCLLANPGCGVGKDKASRGY
jgi:hypothetical protein